MSLVDDLLDELRSYERSSRNSDGFPQDTFLEEGSSVDLVSQTYFNNTMFNIFCVSQTGVDDVFIAIYQGDGGVVSGCGGPWGSLNEAESAIAEEPPEGWTRL